MSGRVMSGERGTTCLHLSRPNSIIMRRTQVTFDLSDIMSEQQWLLVLQTVRGIYHSTSWVLMAYRDASQLS